MELLRGTWLRQRSTEPDCRAIHTLHDALWSEGITARQPAALPDCGVRCIGVASVRWRHPEATARPKDRKWVERMVERMKRSDNGGVMTAGGEANGRR